MIRALDAVHPICWAPCASSPRWYRSAAERGRCCISRSPRTSAILFLFPVGAGGGPLSVDALTERKRDIAAW